VVGILVVTVNFSGQHPREYAMIHAIILAFPVAAIVWAVAIYVGYPLGYVETVVYVIVAKAIAMYLKNDTRVELNVVNTKEETEEWNRH